MGVGAVIFDLGGVLIVDGEPITRRPWEARLGLAPGDLDRLVIEAVGPGWSGGRTEDDFRRHLGESTGLDAVEVEALLEDFHADVYLDPVLMALIEGVRPALKVATLSNAGPTQRRELNRKFELERRVDLIVISAEEGIEKPDPAIYLRTAGRLGVAPTDCVFIDDRLVNVEGAQAVGMTAIVHRDAGSTVGFLEGLAASNVWPPG